MKSTPLEHLGCGMQIAGIAIVVLTVFVGFIFPPLWILSLIILAGLLTTRGKGRCPVCGEYLEVMKKSGGVQCKGCKSGLSIRKGRLWEV